MREAPALAHFRETIFVADVLHAARVADESPYLNPERLPHERAVDAILNDINDATTATLKGRTLKNLALSGSEPCSGLQSGTLMKPKDET